MTTHRHHESGAASGHHGQSCRELVEAISGYVGGELTASRCRALEVHLAQCPCCDRFAGSLRRAIEVCKAAGQARLPPPVQRRARQRILDLMDSLPARPSGPRRPRTARAR